MTSLTLSTTLKNSLQYKLRTSNLPAFDQQLLDYMRSRCTGQFYFGPSDAATCATYITTNIGDGAAGCEQVGDRVRRHRRQALPLRDPGDGPQRRTHRRVLHIQHRYDDTVCRRLHVPRVGRRESPGGELLRFEEHRTEVRAQQRRHVHWNQFQRRLRGDGGRGRHLHEPLLRFDGQAEHPLFDRTNGLARKARFNGTSWATLTFAAGGRELHVARRGSTTAYTNLNEAVPSLEVLFF